MQAKAALDEYEKKRKEEEEEANRFKLEDAYQEALRQVALQVKRSAERHGYTTTVIRFGYAFDLVNPETHHRWRFNTSEFAESFSTITGLKSRAPTVFPSHAHSDGVVVSSGIVDHHMTLAKQTADLSNQVNDLLETMDAFKDNLERGKLFNKLKAILRRNPITNV
jgi:hypothetical protein